MESDPPEVGRIWVEGSSVATSMYGVVLEIIVRSTVVPEGVSVTVSVTVTVTVFSVQSVGVPVGAVIVGKAVTIDPDGVSVGDPVGDKVGVGVPEVNGGKAVTIDPDGGSVGDKVGVVVPEGFVVNGGKVATGAIVDVPSVAVGVGVSVRGSTDKA
jgi:hypothetical protein